jgi:hypothetical protein
MSLTQAERAAGRAFRDQAMVRMAQLVSPEAEEKPGFLRHVRHECPLREGRTWAVELREYYILNPAREGLEAGRLAFMWRAGQCKCGYAIRSGRGRVVEPEDRPPLRGATEVTLTG